MLENKAVKNYLARHKVSCITPKAALIDMDGVLYDSMKNHVEAWYRTLTPMGIPCEKDEFYLYAGRTGSSTIKYLFDKHFDRRPSDEECAEIYAIKGKHFNELPDITPMPGADRMLQRSDREKLLGQRGVMLWFTGLSGSGKSTLAVALERELYNNGILCRILDGDNIRTGINNNLGFSEADRIENIRRIAEVAKLFVDCGIVTIAAFISPTEEIRQMAANIIGSDDFLEIYVSTPLEVCEERDVKGLYKKARQGEIKNFTGISAPFEAPSNPAVTIDTSAHTLEESINLLKKIIMPQIKPM